MSTTRQGPALTITGTCEGCAFLDPEESWSRGKRAMLCVEPSLLGRGPRYIGGLRSATPAWCRLLPAARLALARSICNHCGADIAPDYLGLYAKPTCEKCANERTGDTSDGPLCADCGDPLADPTTAEECSIRHGAGESEE